MPISKPFSDFRSQGSVRLGAHLLTVIAFGIGFGMADHPTLQVVLACAFAVSMNFLGFAQHELSHGAVFEGRRANRVWAALIGFAILRPQGMYRARHLAHHRHTGAAGLDPERVGLITLAGPAAYLLILTGVPRWFARLSRLLSTARSGADEGGQRTALMQEAQLHLTLYGFVLLPFVFLESTAVLTYWLLPLALGGAPVEMIRQALHLGMARSDRPEQTTRVVRLPLPLRWLSWGAETHLIHHQWPRMPAQQRRATLAHVLNSETKVNSVNWLTFHLTALRRLGQIPPSERPKDRIWI